MSDRGEYHKAHVTQHAEFRPVEKEAEEGDMAMIDFEGFMDGKPIKDGNAKDYRPL